MRSYIKVCTSLYVVLEVSTVTYPHEQILPLCFQETFYRGALILSSSHFNREVILLLCCKSPLSRLSASTGGNRKRFKDERHNSTTDNKEFAEMLISSNLCRIRDSIHHSVSTIQYPPFCQFCHVLLLYCVECRTLKWHVCLSCSLFNLCFPFPHQKFNNPRISCPPPVCAGGKGALD